MILFSSNINSSTTNTIQNIFINLIAIKVRVKLKVHVIWTITQDLFQISLKSKIKFW